MQTLQNKKILIIDGISGVSLAQELAASIFSLNNNCEYIDLAKLKKKPFYKPRQATNKIIHQTLLSKEFHYTPKISFSDFSIEIEQEKPNIIFVVGFLYRFIDLELMAALKEKLGFSLYLYDTDSCNLFSRRRELLYFVNKEFPIYDKIFSFSSVMAEFANKLNNSHVNHFPFGASPIPQPEQPIDKVYDVFFIGSADLRRIFLLEKLVDYNIAVYGSRWAKNQSITSLALQKKITEQNFWGKALHQKIHQSKIILNITRSGFYGVETGVNLRIFETLAAGAFLLTDYCDELADLFTIGHHIETFSSSEEMVDKVNYYLKHDNKREQIARNGYALYKEKFTWEKRAEELLTLF